MKQHSLPSIKNGAIKNSTIKKSSLKTTLSIGLLAASLPAVAATNLNFYNWSDYIAPNTLESFEQETGINVTYDVFDSNEVLEAKLMAGGSGFDIVVPSSQFLGRQIQAGIFQEMDLSQLPNYSNLDPELMQVLTEVDPGNRYGIPYLWGTTGIGYNVEQVKAVLGEDAPVNSWDLIFKPEYLSKLRSCGVAILDAPGEVMPIALNYLGKDPNSTNKKDYKGNSQLAKLLKTMRPNVRYFHSSQYINDLANGEVCVALGWSGDILQAASRAEENGNGVKVDFTIPKEGAPVWFDMLAVPADASNTQEAFRMVNYLLRPDVMAGITNYVAFANANKASYPLINSDILQDKRIYPGDDVKQNLFPLKVKPNKIDKAVTRLWTNMKANR